MSVSIVIPTHDTREMVGRAIASARRERDLRGAACELVVVDDGSRDGTAQAVREAAPEARLLRNEAARGFSAAANRGLGEAQGDLLVLLNSDAELLPGALAALEAAFAAEPRLGVAGAELFHPDGRPQWSGGRAPTLAWLFALSSGLPALLRRLPGRRRSAAGHRGAVEWVSGAAMALRRETWRDCGPLDEGYAFYCQDLDLCWAARRAAWGVRVVPGFAAVHRHGSTIARGERALAGQRPDLLWPDLVRCLEKYRGAIFARRAVAALRCGVALRLAARALAAPWAGDRDGFAAASAALRAARASLAERRATAC